MQFFFWIACLAYGLGHNGVPLEIEGAESFESQIHEMYDNCNGDMPRFKKQLSEMFGDAEVTIKSEAGKVKITIAAPSIIDDFQFVNFPNLKKDKLHKIVEQSIFIGDNLHNYKVWKAAKTLELVARDAGYLHAKVETKLMPKDNVYTTIKFICTPGTQTKISKIVVNCGEQIKGGMLQLPSAPLIPWFQRPFNQLAVLEGAKQITSQLQAIGYMDAQTRTSVKLVKNKAYVTYNIEPGHRYKLTGIRFSGYCTDKNKNQLTHKIRNQPLTRFAYQSFLAEAERLLTTEKSIMRHDLILDKANHTALIHIQIHPAQPVVIKDVEFSGNNRSYQNALLPKIGIYPGDIITGRTPQYLTKRSAGLGENGIAFHGNVKDEILKLNVQDALTQQNALWASGGVSYTQDGGFDVGISAHYRDANFLDLGPALFEASIKDTGQRLQISTKKLNPFGLNTIAFAELHIHRINQRRFMNYMNAHNNAFHYMKHTTAIADARIGATIPSGFGITLQPYIKPSISRYGVEDLPELKRVVALFNSNIFPKSNQLTVTLGNEFSYQLVSQAAKHKVSCDISATLFSGKPFLTYIAAYSGSYSVSGQPINLELTFGQVLNNDYWINNLNSQFLCKLLGAIPSAGPYFIGGKNGYRATISSPILVKNAWNLHAFLESGCVWNSGLDAAAYGIHYNRFSGNFAAGLMLNLTTNFLPPVQFVVGVPMGKAGGYELISEIRWNFNLGTTLL